MLPSNCVSTDTKGVCTECCSGYYLNSNYVCKPLPDNCLKVDKYGNCIDCEDDYVVNEDGLC